MTWRNWFMRNSSVGGAGSERTQPTPVVSSPTAWMLEPRVLFDGAIAATAAEAATTAAEHPAQSEASAADSSNNDSHGASQDNAHQAASANNSSEACSDVAAVAGGETRDRKEVAFVDTSVKDYQQLVAGIKPGTEVVLIDGSQDGLKQIADWAASHQGYDAIHIFSHGSEGKLNLGTLELTDASLQNATVQSELATLGKALTADGDLLLYGCDIAGGDKGSLFLDDLSNATGADVAASVDATGNSLIGGNWTLEKHSGSIESAAMEIDGYSDLLTVINFSYEDGDLDYSHTSVTRQIDGYTMTFSSGSDTLEGYGIGADGSPEGLYGLNAAINGSNTKIIITPPAGYTFDLTGLSAKANTQTLHFVLTFADGSTSAFDLSVPSDSANYGSFSSFPNAINDVTKVVITSNDYSALRDLNITDIKAAVVKPSVTSASYDASSHVLTVTGANMVAGDTIDVSKLTLKGENGASYTLTSANVTATSATSFSITLNNSDWLNVGGLLDKNGTTSASSGTVFNLSAAAGWDSSQASTPADLSGNAVTVSNVQMPTISSSTYDSSTGLLTVTGSNLVRQSGANNDIDVTKLTFTGQNGGTYTLTSNTSSVEITSATSFSVVLGATDKAMLAQLLNQNGTSASSGNTYNLAAADDWNGPITGGNIADLTGNAITVSGVNAPPVISNLNGDSVAYTEGSLPVLLDVGGNATVTDSDSANFNGGNVTASISANRSAGEDVLSIVNQGSGAGQIGVSVSTVTYAGVVIGTLAGGTGSNDLVISLNGNATPAAVQALIRALSYQNNNNADPSTLTRTVNVSVNDGAGGVGTAALSVTVTGVNDAPTLTATGGSVTYTENGSAVALFSGATVNTVEAGQTISAMTLTVSNLSDGSSELLRIDGSDITLVNGASGTTAGNGLSYSVSTLGGVATVSLSKSAGISAAAAALLTNGISYRNSSENPTAASRTVTLTSIKDSGGTVNGGVDTTSLSIAATVNVVAVNDAPTISAPATLSVTEDVASGLSDISFNDVDAGSASVTVTFSVGSGVLTAISGAGVSVSGSGTGSLVMQGAIADINAFISAGKLAFTTASNATGSVTLNISIDDGGNSGIDPGTSGTASSEAASTSVTLNVAAVNDAPVNAVPTAQLVQQDGVLVFNDANGNRIAVSDIDIGSGAMQITLTATHGVLTLSSTSGLTFSVGSGSGVQTMTFSGSISAVNNALNGLIYTPVEGYSGSATLQIVSNDQGNTGSGGAQSDSDVIDINVNPNVPYITSVSSSTPNGTYKVGDVVDITLTFSSAVTVNGGTPALLLETGTVDHQANYISGSGSNTLTFRYVVQSGDASGALNYASTSALQLNGATLRDGNSQDASAQLPALASLNSLSGQKEITIDGVAPTASITLADSALKSGQTTTVTIAFSEAVTGFSYDDLVVSNGTLSGLSSQDGGQTWTAVFSPTADITSGVNYITLSAAGVTDLAGNAGQGVTTSASYSIDTQRPTATVTVADSSLNAGQSTTVTFSFSEPVTNFSNQDIIVVGGSLSGVTSADGGQTWTAIYTPSAGITSAANQITLNASGVNDLAGNEGFGEIDSNSFSIDTELPSASIVVSSSALKSGDQALVTVTFSEAVSGFSSANLNVANGTLGAMSSSDGGITWTGVFTPADGLNGVSGQISLNTGSVTDLAGNHGEGTVHSNSFSVDTRPPVATIVVGDSALRQGQSAPVTITFSEPVTGFSNASLNVSNGTLSNLTSEDGGITWTGSFTPLSGITSSANQIGLDTSTLSDLAGNHGAGTVTSNSFSIDTRPPESVSLTLNATPGPQTLSYNLVFSEPVTGVDIHNFVVRTSEGTSATIHSVTAISPTTYRIDLTDVTGVGAVRLDFNGAESDIRDLAGNGLEQGTVHGDIHVNTAPIANPGSLQNQTATGGQPFSYVLPANAFVNKDSGDTLRYSATLADGSPLPGWLTFNAQTGTFSGNPQNNDAGTLNIRLTATDNNNVTASGLLTLSVNKSVATPSLPTNTSTPDGRNLMQQPDGGADMKAIGSHGAALSTSASGSHSQMATLTAVVNNQSPLAAPGGFNGSVVSSVSSVAGVFANAGRDGGTVAPSLVASVFADHGVSRYETGVVSSKVADFNQPQGGKSVLAGMFGDIPLPGSTALEVFNGGSWHSVSPGNTRSLVSPASVFGAPVFSQQIKSLDEYQHLQIAALKAALQNGKKTS